MYELYMLTALLLNAYRSKDDTKVVDQAQVNVNSLEQGLAYCLIVLYFLSRTKPQNLYLTQVLRLMTQMTQAKRLFH